MLLSGFPGLEHDVDPKGQFSSTEASVLHVLGPGGVPSVPGIPGVPLHRSPAPPFQRAPSSQSTALSWQTKR